MVVPEVAQAAEKTLEEQLQHIKIVIEDTKMRIERFKRLDPPDLRKAVSVQFFSELGRRVKSAKESAEAAGVIAALAETGTDNLKRAGELYQELERLEKEMEALRGKP